MTTFTRPPATVSSRPARRARAIPAGLWVIRLLLSIQFAIGGVVKLAGAPDMVAMFDSIGAGQGLRLLIAVCEIAGAVGLLVPRLARLAATGLIGLMVGAAVTNIVVLQVSPVVPLVLLVLAVPTAVGLGCRRSR